MTSRRSHYNSYGLALNRKKSDAAIRDASTYRLHPEKHPRRTRALKAKRASSMV